MNLKQIIKHIFCKHEFDYTRDIIKDKNGKPFAVKRKQICKKCNYRPVTNMQFIN